MIEIIENFNDIFSSKIFIAVPHSDDEIIGCGFLLKNIKNKENISLLYFRDNADMYAKKYGYKDITETRQNEAIRALESLGITKENLTFLNLTSSELKSRKEPLQNLLKQHISEFDPQYILVPFRFDFHPDHISVNRLLNRNLLMSFPHIKKIEYFVYYNWKLLPQKDVRRIIQDDYLLVYYPSKDDSECKRKLFSFYGSQTSLFYKGQQNAILSEEYIKATSLQPEFYLKSFAEKEDNIFRATNIYLRIICSIEPSFKRLKDRFYGHY